MIFNNLHDTCSYDAMIAPYQSYEQFQLKGFHMSLFHFLKQLDPLQNFSFTRLLYFPRQHVFVQNTINFVKVEYNVQLTNIAEVAVQ